MSVFVIIHPEPARCIFPDLTDRCVQVLIAPAVTHGSVGEINIGILPRLARLDMLDADLKPLSPSSQYFADVLRPIVNAQRLGLASPFNDLVQTAITRSEGTEKPISIPSPPRLKSSITLRRR